MTAEITKFVRLTILVVLALVGSACTTTVAGTPTATGDVVAPGDSGESTGVDPSFVRNTDSGEIDRLAATVVTDVQTYWRETFPDLFGQQWRDISGGFYSVDSGSATAPAPPCASRASDVEGNAFYCPTADVIAWDRTALLPVLKERFGEAAVMLVLAHEMGHAVQRRAGVAVTQSGSTSDLYPTIAIEAMADCYAGAFVHWVLDGKAEHLRVDRADLDPSLQALVSFRDPIGTSASDQGAHGDAFDRVSAFQDGFEQGPQLCARMTAQNRDFTLRGFANAKDLERGGNLAFTDMITSISPDLNTFFSGVVERSGGQWREPRVAAEDGEPRCATGDQGPATFCEDRIGYSEAGALADLHGEIGDYATGTLLASRYALAALAALGKPVRGPDTQRGVVCLAGAYTGLLISRQENFTLSPGDLDEAMQVLLRFDFAARDAAGAAIPSGYDRVSAFRAGTLKGTKACGL